MTTYSNPIFAGHQANAVHTSEIELAPQRGLTEPPQRSYFCPQPAPKPRLDQAADPISSPSTYSSINKAIKLAALYTAVPLGIGVFSTATMLSQLLGDKILRTDTTVFEGIDNTALSHFIGGITVGMAVDALIAGIQLLSRRCSSDPLETQHIKQPQTPTSFDIEAQLHSNKEITSPFSNHMYLKSPVEILTHLSAVPILTGLAGATGGVISTLGIPLNALGESMISSVSINNAFEDLKLDIGKKAENPLMSHFTGGAVVVASLSLLLYATCMAHHLHQRINS